MSEGTTTAIKKMKASNRSQNLIDLEVLMFLVILSTFGLGPFEHKTGDNSPNKRRAALLFHAGVSTHCRMARHRPFEGISDILDFEIRPPRLLIHTVDRDNTLRIDLDQVIGTQGGVSS